MLINVLLSTFGIALRGIDIRSNYVETRFHSTLCRTSQTESFPNSTTLVNAQRPILTVISSPIATQRPQTSVVAKAASSPLPETISQRSPLNQTCAMGYSGTFPDCKRITQEKCRYPSIGSYPNCFIPPCPPRYLGTYPKCKRPVDQICPFGSTGSFPECVVSVRNCSDGSICVNEILEPSIQSSTQASYTSSNERPVTNSSKIEWEEFKRMFNKTYTNQTNEEHRRQIFLHNQEIVHAHNEGFERGMETFSLAINELSDQTSDELIGGYSMKELDNQKLRDIYTLYTVTERVKTEAKNFTSKASRGNK